MKGLSSSALTRGTDQLPSDIIASNTSGRCSN